MPSGSARGRSRTTSGKLKVNLLLPHALEEAVHDLAEQGNVSTSVILHQALADGVQVQRVRQAAGQQAIEEIGRGASFSRNAADVVASGLSGASAGGPPDDRGMAGDDSLRPAVAVGV